MTDQCNRCRFWCEEIEHRDPNDPDWGFGKCRRAPPIVVDAMVKALMPPLRYGQQEDPEIETVTMTSCSMWPATVSTDWCGRFEDRKPGWPAC